MLRGLTRRGSAEPTAQKNSTAAYDALFDSHKEQDEDSIGPEGIERLCTAMGVDPSDVLLLVLAWTLGASNMGYFTREEWSAGREALGSVTSALTLKSTLAERLITIQRDEKKLRGLWLFAHLFCREERRKNIDVASACAMLRLVLWPLYSAHIDGLLEFIEQHESSAKRGVTQDEWAMMLPFCREIDPDCANFGTDGAWPLLLDDFVEWKRERAAAPSAEPIDTPGDAPN